MKKRLRIIQGKVLRHKTLVANFGYLSALQIFTMLAPLVTYPYLIRVFGKDTYGLIIFAQAVVSYFKVLVDFGFSTFAAKEVSVHRDDPNKLSEIVSSVLIIKGFLFIFALMALTAVLQYIPGAREHEILFYVSMHMCLYEFLFPVWYFRGTEKMKYITFIQVSARLISLVLIFILIHNKEHYLRLPAINAIGSVLGAGIALWVVFGKIKVRFKWQPLRVLRKYIHGTLYIFAAGSFSLLFGSTAKVILGLATNTAQVAYFDLADKLVRIARMPSNLFGQVVFPKLARVNDKSVYLKVVTINVSIGISGILITQIFASYIITFFGGAEMMAAVVILRVLVFMNLPSVFSSTSSLFYHVHGLIAEYMKTIAFSGLLMLLIYAILYFSAMSSGLAIAAGTVVVELVMAFIIGFYLLRHLNRKI